METYHLRLPQSVRETIAELARLQRRSKTAVVIDAVEQALESERQNASAPKVAA